MNKRFHAKLQRPMIVIQPGEYYVTAEDEVIATVLGSCISVCLKDEKHNIGGMNHFMLPGDFRSVDTLTNQSARYGMYAMELLLGDLIKLGGDRSNLTAKVFGGGHVLKSVANSARSVPQSNIDFIKAFLSMEGIPISSQDVGGDTGRKVLYLPRSGKAYIKKLASTAQTKIVGAEDSYKKKLTREVKGEDLTLF